MEAVWWRAKDLCAFLAFLAFLGAGAAAGVRQRGGGGQPAELGGLPRKERALQARAQALARDQTVRPRQIIRWYDKSGGAEVISRFPNKENIVLNFVGKLLLK
jgi:hypothetical protein